MIKEGRRAHWDIIVIDYPDPVLGLYMISRIKTWHAKFAEILCFRKDNSLIEFFWIFDGEQHRVELPDCSKIIARQRRERDARSVRCARSGRHLGHKKAVKGTKRHIGVGVLITSGNQFEARTSSSSRSFVQTSNFRTHISKLNPLSPPKRIFIEERLGYDHIMT